MRTVTYLNSLALAGASLLLLTGCDTKVASRQQTQYTSAEVVRQDLTGYLYLDGSVYVPPGAQADAYSPYDLPIKEVTTAVGKRVNRGQVIARLTIPGHETTVAQAEANAAAARAAYAAAREPYKAPVDEAERALSEARAAERQARADAQAGLPADVVGAQLAREAAEDAVREANAELNASLLSERQSLAIANEYLAEVRSGSGLISIRAPISGTVVSLEAKPGLMAKSRQSLATIVDHNKVRIQGVLPPEHKDEVKVGSILQVSLESADAEALEARVIDINVLPPKQGQQSTGYLVLARLLQRDESIRKGTVVKRLALRTDKVEDALVVPVGAVSRNDAGQPVVHVNKGQQWTQTAVTLGPSDGALVVVKSGVSEGQVVRVETKVASR